MHHSKSENRAYAKVCNVMTEYYPDVTMLVRDIQRDVINKFPEYETDQRKHLSSLVMHNMLFHQICHIVSGLGDERYWKDLFRDMEDQCIDICRQFAWKDFIDSKNKKHDLDL